MVDQALNLYRQGWFPMDLDDPKQPGVQWVQPHERALIPLDGFRTSRSLRAKVRKQVFRVTTDHAFGRVIRACAGPRSYADGTWLHPEIIALFELFHAAGHAHSVEAWLDTPAGPELVGGLYGLAIGRVFCGESMFSQPDRGGTDASKVCLVHLVSHLRARGFAVLDAQMPNHHTDQFGATLVGTDHYQKLLTEHAGPEHERAWLPFIDRSDRAG
ncbi:MAG: leucyl/phenylalanyl-tRNA--protein transferase [Planctomycetota bacterium]|nr:leucyl/phenylalanyl-tRNA--protein transferase [Planctomycetota bacterium]